jgi:outer membrane protein TolC
MRLENRAIVLRQQEIGAKAMMMAILNRRGDDTIGVALMYEAITTAPSLDALYQFALRTRPMLLHDSLSVEEGRTMVSLSRQGYLPDIRLGIQYVTTPLHDFRGWSVSAGMTLPFAPWSLSRTGARVEEAEASFQRSTAKLAASRAMVMSRIHEIHSRILSLMSRVRTYRDVILPQAELSAKTTLASYRTGKSDFLMMMDSFRTKVELEMESLSLRMQLEQAVALLEQQVGIHSISEIR